MATNKIELYGLQGFPLVEPGDDPGEIIVECLGRNCLELADGDTLIIAQKIISKAENRYRYLNDVIPTETARELAESTDKDSRLMQCILDESTEILRMRKGAIIVRHRNGYVHANAGIDQSNIVSQAENPRVLLLPENPDASAFRIMTTIRTRLNVNIQVVINDSAGRPWRNGIMGYAIGTAGFEVVENHVGNPDLFGKPLQITEVAVADELAAAGSLLMGQGNEGVPVVLVRGMRLKPSSQGSAPLIRAPEQDLFR